MNALKTVKKAASKKIAKNDAKNVSNIKKAIQKNLDLTYIYPKGCTELPERKKFRTDARRHRDSFTSKIAKAIGAEKEVLKQEARGFASKVFAKGHQPKF